MNFREITLDDKSLFEDFEYIGSDYIFSNLFMYELLIAKSSKSLLICSDPSKLLFYLPLGDTEQGISEICKHYSKINKKPTFRKIPEGYVDLFKKYKFSINEDRNSFDYVYANFDLAFFKGKEFRKHRNNLSSYLSEYTPSFTNDIEAHIEECTAFTKKYFTKNEIIVPTLKILDNFDYFNLKGGIVWNEGKIQGFCAYESVGTDTVISHIELTDNSHRGIHAYMINEMSKNINEEYINKEDDVGLPGLRRFKESYNPNYMVKKYTATLE